MVKELTKKDLMDEISELRQKVIELQSEIIRLKGFIHPQPPIFPDPLFPYYGGDDSTGGWPLLNQPLNLCTPVCQGGRGY